MSTQKFVICCSKLWDSHIAEKLAKATGCEFHLVQKKEELNPAFLAKLNPAQIFFPHWSYIIPAEIHQSYRCIIFHMTDLPFGRGGSPLQNLIARELDKTKISGLICTAGLDEGDILLKRDLDLHGTAEEIFKRATEIIQGMILDIIKENPTPQPQSGEVTLFKRRTPAESNLNSAETLRQAYDLIRMLDSDLYPRAFLETAAGLKIEFSDAHLEQNEVVAKVRIKL